MRYSLEQFQDKFSKSISAPWVLIAGGFHYHGGMDRANAALAEYLIQRGTSVHLVANQIDLEFLTHPKITAHLVPRPAGSFLLGELILAWYGRKVAKDLCKRWPGTRVLINGGNCIWPDINWVHYVHHAWSYTNHDSPLWYKIKERLVKPWLRHRESRALRLARVIISNSEQTRRHLVERLGLDESKIYTVYYGSDPNWEPASPGERATARAQLNVADSRPVVVFLGALGYDHRKGFDILLAAWRALCSRPDWNANLVVAGGGNELSRWQARIVKDGLASRVQMLGFTERVYNLLAAADLLVSPVRYEPYGLNVQEAICRGVPAMVSRSAGVAEQYPPELYNLLVPNPEHAEDLIERLLAWRERLPHYRELTINLSKKLRRYTWEHMAAEIVKVAEENGREIG